MRYLSGHNDRECCTDTLFDMRAFRNKKEEEIDEEEEENKEEEKKEETTTVMLYDCMRGEPTDPKYVTEILSKIRQFLELPKIEEQEVAEFLMVLGNIPVDVAKDVK